MLDWIPNILLEGDRQPFIRCRGFASVLEHTASIRVAGVSEVIVPIAILPAANHSCNVADCLNVPTIDLMVSAVGEGLLCLKGLLQDGNPSDSNT